MASAKKKTEPKAEAVQGVESSMPGLPGPAEPIDTEAPIDVIGPIGPGESASGVATGDGTGTPLPEVSVDAYPPGATPLGAPVELMPGVSVVSIPAKASPYNVWPKRKYRVWPHGELHRDGVVYKPGDELVLTEDIAKTIECLEPVD